MRWVYKALLMDATQNAGMEITPGADSNSLPAAFDFLRSDQISNRPIDLRHYATDQWPLAKFYSRHDHAIAQPLAVLWPESAEQVAKIVKTARQRHLKIIPYGAGSGVCGGAWAEPRAITVDLKRLRQVL